MPETNGLLSRHKYKILLGMTVLGAALRLLFIDYKSVALDESWSIFVGQKNFFAVPGIVATSDFHPPFYYMVLSLFMAFGSGEAIARLPSVVFGSLTIPVAFLVARRLTGLRESLLTSYLLTISPMHIRYSQEARMYALLAFLAILSLYFLLKALNDNKSQSWIGYSLTTALALYTHYYGVIVLGAEASFLILKRFLDRQFRIQPALLLSIAAAVVLFLPWALGVTSVQAQHTSLAKRDLLVVLARLYAHFTLFLPVTRASSEVLRVPQILSWGLYGLIMSLFALLFLYAILKRVRGSSLYLSITWIFAPVAAAFVLMYQVARVAAFRSVYYLYEVPIYLFVISNGITGIKSKKLVALLLVIITFGYSISITVNYFLQNEDWRDAAAYVRSNLQPGDAAVFDSPYVQLPFSYYIEDKSSLAMLTFDELKKNPEAHHRVWLVISHIYLYNPSEDMWQGYGPDKSEVKQWIDKCFENLDGQRFQGLSEDVYVFLYVTAPCSSTE